MSPAMEKSFKAAFEQEVRFALVMYDGVSLAIYINGVTQEFLHLVKATAADSDGNLIDDGPLTGTQAVYRKLASIVSSRGECSADSQLRTRFIVDIASGSSAGGINAIFLGKALANNATLDELSTLWQEQAGMEDLLNDSLGDGKRFKQDPPQSLLSCPGIYSKLLDALIGMDNRDDMPRPIQPEMDVFITATDLQGLELPIQLSDMQILEKRYKNVFQMRFATDESGVQTRNDFSPEHNAFLAFAARATSSFPVAFEPMTLEDMDGVASQKSPRKPLFKSDSDKLEKFFPDYISASADGGYTKRAFGDGGDLDNKPFSHAIDALSRRTADLPLRRKLVYIEPSPDPARGNDTAKRPNFLENTLAATVTLHLAETIRDDLQRVLERNRLIERVKKVTNDFERDLDLWKETQPAFDGYREQGYEVRTIAQESVERGPGYVGYHRLKVAAVTDDLARLIVNAAELLEESDEFRAIRFIIGAWRDNEYPEHHAPFLLSFDLMYRERRLRFLLSKLDKWIGTEGADPTSRNEIRTLKRSLNAVALEFSRLRADIEARGEKNLAYAQVKALDLDSSILRELLTLPEKERTRWIENYLKGDAVKKLAAFVASRYETTTRKAAAMLKAAIDPKSKDVTTEIARELRSRLWQYFDDYEFYDQVMFPIFYQTSVGEAEPADVIRISPEDATSVINEKDPKERRRKLAGLALFHFAAFLDPLWRSNDILWGRLDGAERIITSLLPPSSGFAKKLIEEAHLAIIRDHFRSSSRKEIANMLVPAIMDMPMNSHKGSPPLRDLLTSKIRVPVDTRVSAVFMNCLTDEQIYEYLKNHYEVNREFHPANSLKVLGRSTQVIGKMFEDVASNASDERVRTAVSRRAARLANVGSILWTLVQLAVPGGMGNQLFRHWVKILYVFEALLLIGSTLTGSTATQQFAVTALMVTAALHLVVAILGDFMRTSRWAYRPLLTIGSVIVLLAGFGFWTLYSKTVPDLVSYIQGYLPWLVSDAK